MQSYQDLTIEELADLFCMDLKEFQGFLQTRDFHLEPEFINGVLTFPLEKVQAYLQSQYFI